MFNLHSVTDNQQKLVDYKTKERCITVHLIRVSLYTKGGKLCIIIIIIIVLLCNYYKNTVQKIKNEAVSNLYALEMAFFTVWQRH